MVCTAVLRLAGISAPAAKILSYFITELDVAGMLLEENYEDYIFTSRGMKRSAELHVRLLAAYVYMSP